MKIFILPLLFLCTCTTYLTKIKKQNENVSDIELNNISTGFQVLKNNLDMKVSKTEQT